MTDIDPSKVKAGDTVTLVQNVEPGASATRIDGPVSAIERYREGGALYFRMGGYLVGIGAEDHQYTLTDHQPGAEPEPALPTTVGSVVLVRSMGGNAMALHLRPAGRGKVVGWTHALGNTWIESIVRDHLIQVLFDASANAMTSPIPTARTLPTRDLQDIRALAQKQAAAYTRMLEIGEGIGGLAVRHPEMAEGMHAWSGATENEHADTVLRLIALYEQGGAAQNQDAEGCPDDCGGCACHIAPPCSHCVEHTTDDDA